jgi:NAD(P)-dependent dehydrogenase (short-subunit alcohol dehydrogenase family)
MHDVFRPELLGDRAIAVAGAPAVRQGLEALGASAHELGCTRDEEAAGAAVDRLLGDIGQIDGFVHAPQAVDPREALDRAWVLVRALATRAFIPEDRGGAVILIAPGPGAQHAEATRAGLENTARTLSVEWARYGIRPVALTPGSSSSDDELVALVAYLLSPAGDYFSGCRLSLGEAVPAAARG